MNTFRDNGLYEIIYEKRNFTFLQFVRMDTICDICYVTLKNPVTGEMFSFDKSKINDIHFRQEFTFV